MSAMEILKPGRFKIYTYKTTFRIRSTKSWLGIDPWLKCLAVLHFLEPGHGATQGPLRWLVVLGL